MAVFVTPYACALGLGEIQVNSNLGEPLKAQVDLIELTIAEARELKVRLASVDEYRKNGLQYPEGIKFSFQLANEQTAQPFFRIATTQPIDDPFVNLLIEISLPSVKIFKTYTFLLDPSPDWSRSLAAGEQSVQQPPQAESPQPNGTPIAQTLVSQPVTANVAVSAQIPAQTIDKTPGSKPVTAVSVKPVKPSYRRKHHEHTSTTEQTIDMPAQTKGGSTAKNRNDKPFGKLSLSLSTGLSISKNDPGVPGGIKNSDDGLQEELIAKEQTINELHLQISEMQALINNLRAKLISGDTSAVADSVALAPSVVATSDVLHVASAVDVSVVPTSKPAVAVTAVTAAEPVNWPELLQRWENLAAALALLLAAGGAIYWHRMRKTEQGSGTFDEFNEVSDQSTMTRPSADTAVSLPVGVQSIKTPIYMQNIPEHALPAVSAIEQTRSAVQSDEIKNPKGLYSLTGYGQEADDLTEVDSMLEEAELYAIHGRQGRAIEMLNDIILEYPEKVDVWLLLLSIFRNTKTAPQFESIAKKFLITMGSNDVWKGVQEAGRSIDPSNPLYFDADSAHATNLDRSVKLNKRRLLGEILVDMNAISVSDMESSLAHFDHLRDGRLGDYLVASGLIKQGQLDDALQQQSKEIADEPPASKIISDANGPHIKANKPSSIGDVLVQMGIVTEQELEHVLAHFDPKRHGRCGTYLVTVGLITEKQLHTALLQQLHSTMAVDIASPAVASPAKDNDYIPWNMPDRLIR